MPLGRDDEVITGLPIPHSGFAVQTDVAVQHLQSRLSRAVVFTQLMSGDQRQYRLAQVMIVAAVNCVCCPATMSLARLGQLLLDHVD